MKKLTIIIPTYNRADSMVRLLKSLADQAKYIEEVIIVEQIHDNEKKFMRAAGEAKLKLKYRHMETTGTSSAKNVGLSLAGSDLVLFLDDDVVADDGLLAGHIRAHEDARTAAVCGRSITEGQSVEPDRTDVGRVNAYGAVSDGYSSAIRQEIDTVIGCNASWKRDVLTQLHGFDERFTQNAMREESDLSLRAKKLGYTIMFEPAALVHHRREPVGGARKGDDRMGWNYHYFSNEMYFFLKHGRHILFPLFVFSRGEYIIRCMFGFGREVSLRSMAMPWLGMMGGVKKYRKYLEEYENRS